MSWRWSDHAGRSGVAGSDLGVHRSVRMRFQMDNGTAFDAAAGDVHLPPGPRRLAVDDDSCVALGLG